MRDLPASRETSSEMATWSFVRVSERFSTSVWHELPVRGGFVVKGTVNDNSDRLSLSTSTPCLTLYDKKRLAKGGSRAPQDPPPSYAIDSCERLPSFLPGRYTSASHTPYLGLPPGLSPFSLQHFSSGSLSDNRCLSFVLFGERPWEN